jgi:hypothetical protein
MERRAGIDRARRLTMKTISGILAALIILTASIAMAVFDPNASHTTSYGPSGVVYTQGGLKYDANYVLIPGTVIVFTRISSAVPSAANLRIGVMDKNMARESKGSTLPIQTFIRDYTQNYYLTKSTTVTLYDPLYMQIQVDQDTKIYRNSDLTNYILCASGSNCYEGVR